MDNGSSIYQDTFRKTSFLFVALPLTRIFTGRILYEIIGGLHCKADAPTRLPILPQHPTVYLPPSLTRGS
jgi:hypothetical protein